MTQIGTFTATDDGGWTGMIQTLTFQAHVQLVPNDKRDNDSAPAFRVLSGDFEIGAAWPQRSSGENPKDYLSVQIDDPSWPKPIIAAFFLRDQGHEGRLFWTRPKPEGKPRESRRTKPARVKD